MLCFGKLVRRSILCSSISLKCDGIVPLEYVFTFWVEGCRRGNFLFLWELYFDALLWNLCCREEWGGNVQCLVQCSAVQLISHVPVLLLISKDVGVRLCALLYGKLFHKLNFNSSKLQ